MWEEVVEDLQPYLQLIDLQDILIALAVFLFFLLARNWMVRFFFKLFSNITGSNMVELDNEVKSSFYGPLKTLLLLLGLFLALTFLPLNEEAREIITQLFRVSVILLIAQGAYNLLNPDSFIFREMEEKFNLQDDKILLAFLSKLVRFVMVALVISIIAEEFDYNVGQFVAGLGIGGLAVAFAAKDTISNFFGGLVIIIDKPFNVGDWIYTPSVEGTVEDVNIRNTKIRTFAKGLVTVPNAALAQEPVTNWSEMGKRRITFHLGVTYATPREKLQKCVEEIRRLLDNHPEVHQETKMVYFEHFSESSLDIFLYFFTIPTDWDEHLRVREDINFKIMQILENEGVSVAFPSRSIYFENSIHGKIEGQKEKNRESE